MKIPELAASRVTRKIESGEYSTKLSRQQYLKHVEGTAQYEAYRQARQKRGLSPQSILTITEEEVERLISDKAGTGIVGVTHDGREKPIEDITANRIIGKYWRGGRYVDTNKVRIHYGRKSSHVSPIGGKHYD